MDFQPNFQSPNRATDSLTEKDRSSMRLDFDQAAL